MQVPSSLMILNGQEILSHIHRWDYSSHEHYVLLWRSSTEDCPLLLSILIPTSLLRMMLQTLKVGKQPAATARDVRLICATLPYFSHIPKLLPLNIFFVLVIALSVFIYGHQK